MRKPVWPMQYFRITASKNPIEKIWDDIDGYSFEEMYFPKEKHEQIRFVIPFPPLKYKGKVVKGLFYSQGVDTILKRFPRLKEIFFVCANSMFSSYPWSELADCYFTCYENKARKKWYLKNHPEKKNIIFLPLQDADFLNEYTIAPTFNTPKTIDVFCVSTVFPVKNIYMLAMAAKAYEEKYGRILKIVHAIGAKDAIKLPNGDLDYSKLSDNAKGELKRVDEILGDTKKYINYIPYIKWHDLPKYYTSSRCCVLTSLMEGKNRFISEAMSCDTPIIVFKDFNKWARASHPVFYGSSGELVPEFTAEALADTIHKVLMNPAKYEPRKNYLINFGRENFVNKCIDLIPYYKKNLPGYKKGSIMNNVWVNLAMQNNYQLSCHDFIYGKNYAIQDVCGMSKIESLVKFFYSRFGIKD